MERKGDRSAGRRTEKRVSSHRDGRVGHQVGRATPQVSQAQDETPRASTSRFKPKIIDNTDPSRFRPKAVRDSAALIWSQGSFPLPPSADVLSRVTRVDLSGSACTDVSWLKGTKVTWLNLKGCKISKGWDAVGSLEDLTVLNISETDLDHLPEALSCLHKLKALVAMGNPWVKLGSGVIEHWAQLNSLIVSHSPKLKSLPSALKGLDHLAKMSFSHCPCISVGGLPDLTDLPLLRDVKLNNLALLDKLPSHLSSWGTGRMPVSEHVPTPRQGDGLEVLDLGNCSLPFSAVDSLFLRREWPHLRSLSLHSNPLAISNPDYADQLRNAQTLPSLQIIDAKRIVERKRKGEVQETRLERRRRLKKERNQSTGSNAKVMSDKSRTWGGGHIGQRAPDTVDSTVGEATDSAGEVSGTTEPQPSTATRKRKRNAETRSAAHEAASAAPSITAASMKPSKPGADTVKKRKRSKTHTRPDRDHQSGQPELNVSDNPAEKRKRPPQLADDDQHPKARPQSGQTSSRPTTKAVSAKVETIIKSAGGVNLKEVLGQPKVDGSSGQLGLGGW